MMGSRPSDRELVHLARQGERAAFATLIERHYPSLRTTCRRALRDSELAGDAAQQATLTALLCLDRLRDDARFGPWLIGIGLNVCRSMLRDRARLARPLDWLADDRWAAGDDPALAAESGEIEARVRAAIESLPNGQQEAVALFYLAGLTQSEIAQQLGTASGAIKTRLHKARRALRASLNELWKEQYPMTTPDTAFVPMHIADLRQTAGDDRDSACNIVFLEGADGARRLPIWIGRPEATALAVSLENVELPRPWTHQFAASLLHAAGGEVREVRIVALTDFTFYAQVVLGDGTAVDSRPSDALTLAVQLGAPILVARAVLDQADARAVHEDDRLDLAAAHERGRDAKEIVQDATSRLRREAERYAARADRTT
jgi:hypothetical protein